MLPAKILKKKGRPRKLPIFRGIGSLEEITFIVTNTPEQIARMYFCLAHDGMSEEYGFVTWSDKVFIVNEGEGSILWKLYNLPQGLAV